LNVADAHFEIIEQQRSCDGFVAEIATDDRYLRAV
jgi:hypothetical protein